GGRLSDGELRAVLPIRGSPARERKLLPDEAGSSPALSALSNVLDTLAFDRSRTAEKLNQRFEEEPALGRGKGALGSKAYILAALLRCHPDTPFASSARSL